jgi:phospholipase C
VATGANDPTNDTTHTGANHQYDLHVFYDALEHAQLPAVSYVKPIYAEDGHPGNSDPLDEQRFLTRTINAIEQSPEWASTAIFIAYDDSDGWYDHVAPNVTNGSNVTADNAGVCLNAPTAATPAGGYQDRCGPSQRLPLLLISPFAKRDYVSDTASSQASIVKFIEYNFKLGTTIGDSSFDTTAGPLSDMFDFKHPRFGTTLLNADGTIKSVTKSRVVLKAASTKVSGGKTTVTVTATTGTSYHPLGRITATLNGRAIPARTLSSAGKAVWTGLRLPSATNTLVFRFAATADYDAASVTLRIKR